MYLYLKTHNVTGMKYLGYTKTDPHKYKGSGKLWKLHIKKHGYNVTTEILFQSDDINSIKQKGLYYSELWNIVESSEWANLIPEEGNGGGNSYNHESNKFNASKGGIARSKLIQSGKYIPNPWNKGIKVGPEPETTRKKKSESHKGAKRSYRSDGSWFWVMQH